MNFPMPISPYKFLTGWGPSPTDRPDGGMAGLPPPHLDPPVIEFNPRDKVNQYALLSRTRGLIRSV